MPRRGKKAGNKKFIWQGRNAFELLPLPSGVPQPMCFCGDPCKVEFNEDKQDEETIIRPKEYMPYEGGRQVNMPLAYEKIMLMLI